MYVQISVNEAYELPAFWSKSNVSNQLWLDLVPKLSELLEKNTTEADVNLARLAAESAIEHVKNALKSSHSEELERQESNHKKRILELEEHLKAYHTNEMLLKNSDDISSLKVEVGKKETIIETLKSFQEHNTSTVKQLTDSLNAQSDLNAQLKDENKRLQAMIPEKPLSYQELGKVAEEEVSGAIQEFIPCEIEDVSYSGKHGDRLIRYDCKLTNVTMELFLEVKNQKDLRKDEIDRFIKQVRQDAIDGRINCAIFLSLKTKTIPHRMHTEIETIDIPNGKKLPVLWLATASKTCIQSSIVYMIALFESIHRENLLQESSDCNSLEVHNEFNVLKESIPDLLAYIDRQDSHIISQMKLAQDLLDDLRNQRDELNDVSLKCSRIKKNSSFLVDPEEEAIRMVTEVRNSKDKALQKINKSDFVISQRKTIEKAGGIARVRSLVEEREKRQKVETH